MTLISTIQSDAKFKKLLIGVFLALVLELFSVLGFKLPTFVVLPLTIILIATVGKSVVYKGIEAITKFNFKSINFLMTVAAIGAFILGEYEEAAVVIVLFSLAERLEDFGFDSSKSALKDLLNKTPKLVSLKNSTDTVSVEQVRLGDILIVKTGDAIAVDGKILLGSAFIDESTITGEPIAQEKTVGDLVYAGSTNQSGYIEIECIKTIKDSTVTKIVELALAANENKADVHQFVQSFSKFYVPFVLLVALLVVVIPTVFLGQELSKWFKEALSILVISCPCAFVISTPISIYCGIANATRRGVLIKGGKYLELIGKLKSIALDKTRTITMGKPAVAEVIAFRGLNTQEVIACAAGLEYMSEHPLAKSVVDEAQMREIDRHSFKRFEAVTGQGVQAYCDVCRDKIMIGKTSFIQNEVKLSRQVEEQMLQARLQGLTPVLVADSKGEKGIIILSDQIKPDSKTAIEGLKKLDLHIAMLTGDNIESAVNIAKQVNINDVKSDLLPDGKLNEIVILKNKYETVAMVGDGVNDAPALAKASLGISMGAVGSDVAIETSDIAILNDKLGLLPYLVQLGRKTLSTIKINTAIAIGTKFLFLMLAILGHSNLVLAIFADVGVTLIVVINSLQLLQFKERVL